MTSEDKTNEIIAAAGGGSLRTVRRLIAEDPSLASGRNIFGTQPIRAAHFRGQQGIVDELLDSGVELDVFLAAELGMVDEVRAHLERDRELVHAFRDVRGDTPLHCAAYWDQRDVAALLLERGAEVNAATRDDFLRIAPLASAVATPNIPNPSDDEQTVVALVQQLLDEGADVNQRRRDGMTALHGAAYRGLVEVTRLLLDQGADRSLTAHHDGGPHEGETAVQTARKQEQRSVADFIEHYRQRS